MPKKSVSSYSFILENWTYKIVSLFIALILWLTILGKKDFVVTKLMDIDVVTSSSLMVANQTHESVRIKVAGPRAGLRKFLEAGMGQVINLDLSKYAEGNYSLSVPTDKIELPFGVRILQVKPSTVDIEIRPVVKKDL
jgi:YbbR domain-containing protein